VNVGEGGDQLRSIREHVELFAVSVIPFEREMKDLKGEVTSQGQRSGLIGKGISLTGYMRFYRLKRKARLWDVPV
jgi:hypothetical protein